MFHVVEGHHELGSVLQEVMAHAVHKSRTFSSAESYLTHLDSPSFVPPTAILADYDLPGLDGIRLIRQIRKTLPEQKAVIFYAIAMPEPPRSLLCYQLRKPFAIETLLSMLQALLHCERDCLARTASFTPQCQYGLESHCPFYQHHMKH